MTTESDRELLEWAARAAGLRLVPGDVSGEPAILITETNRRPAMFQSWNPLTDDGDALRLAVKLELDICHTLHDPPKIGVWCDVVNDFIEEERAPDQYAATRRAITLAAAAIGKEMKL